jgi:uncharacterized membrane protein YphA (DoxX/SURF4 family)
VVESVLERVLQRLFSTFANGAPGVGLLLQRFVTAAALFYCAVVHVSIGAATAGVVPYVAAAVAGLLLMIGLWTPVAASVIAAGELWIAVSSGSNPATPIFIAAVAGGLALIGPGAWSVDALLFGRKRI